MLHRIESRSNDDWEVVRQNSISRQALEQRLDPLGSVVGLRPDQLLDASSFEHAPGLLLSCDDGFASVEGLVSLLDERDLNLLLFVTVGFLDGTVQPYELQLADLMANVETFQANGRAYACGTRDAREAAYRSVREPLKPQPEPARARALQRLAQANGLALSPLPPSTFLSWDRLRTLASHPRVFVGAHGVTHVPLAAQDWRTQWLELKQARQRLESELSQSVEYVSYPYGSNSGMTRRLARWAGYRMGFTTEARSLSAASEIDPLAIPRRSWREPGV